MKKQNPYGIDADHLLGVLRTCLAQRNVPENGAVELRHLVELPMTDTQKRVWDAALEYGISRAASAPSTTIDVPAIIEAQKHAHENPLQLD